MSVSSLPSLITDRAQADVARWDYLFGRVSTGAATAEEAEEWKTPLKGTYNVSDLNRVGAAVEYIAGRLNGYGYKVTVTPKLDWAETDIPTTSQMETYIRDVATLRGAISVLSTTPLTPDSALGLTWQEANDIEKILIDVDDLLTKMAGAWFYAGDIYSGEV